jgi:GTP pyrophosphokinase
MPEAALKFAIEKHRGQIRKFIKEPYIHHIIRVAGYCILYVDGDQNLIQQIAYLHDVIEDTDVTYENLKNLFSDAVAEGVFDLTNLYTKENFPAFKRHERKRKEIDRLANCPKIIQQIKLCDRLDNVHSLLYGDKFWQTRYKDETLYMLEKIGNSQEYLANLIEKLIK